MWLDRNFLKGCYHQWRQYLISKCLFLFIQECSHSLHITIFQIVICHVSLSIILLMRASPRYLLPDFSVPDSPTWSSSSSQPSVLQDFGLCFPYSCKTISDWLPSYTFSCCPLLSGLSTCAVVILAPNPCQPWTSRVQRCFWNACLFARDSVNLWTCSFGAEFVATDFIHNWLEYNLTSHGLGNTSLSMEPVWENQICPSNTDNQLRRLLHMPEFLQKPMPLHPSLPSCNSWYLLILVHLLFPPWNLLLQFCPSPG